MILKPFKCFKEALHGIRLGSQHEVGSRGLWTCSQGLGSKESKPFSLFEFKRKTKVAIETQTEAFLHRLSWCPELVWELLSETGALTQFTKFTGAVMFA